MSYPADVTYNGDDLEDVRQRLHYVVDEISDGEDDNYKAWYAEGAEAILVWLAAGKPDAREYDAGNSMLADLIREVDKQP